MMKVLTIMMVVLVIPLISAKDQLISVTVLARHGARTPMHSLDPFIEEDFWVYDGSLTGVGMRQHYQLGRYLRMKYIENVSLLNDTYIYNELKAVSSNTQRTI
jgi:hypothetical protein